MGHPAKAQVSRPWVGRQAGVSLDASPVIVFVYMGKRSQPRKDTDYETVFRCAGSVGILREEVWVDEKGEVVRYNLALVVPHVSGLDNGRVLGCDNAHGTHERHYMGSVEPAESISYDDTSNRFYEEAESIRRKL